MLVAEPTSWLMSRALTAFCGSFLTKRITASPNNAVRSSKSYGRCAGNGESSRSTIPDNGTLESGYERPAPATSFDPWTFRISFGALVFRYFGVFMSFDPHRFIEVRRIQSISIWPLGFLISFPFHNKRRIPSLLFLEFSGSLLATIILCIRASAVNDITGFESLETERLAIERIGGVVLGTGPVAMYLQLP